jgi:hypothetical protein
MFRHFGQLHDGRVGEVWDGVEPVEWGQGYASTRVDENPFSFQHLVADLETVWVEEAGVATVQVEVFPLLHFALQATSELTNDLVLARDHLR